MHDGHPTVEAGDGPQAEWEGRTRAAGARLTPQQDDLITGGTERGSPIGDAVHLTSEFRMFEFKIKPCNLCEAHDWSSCLFAHPGERAARRDPRVYRYDSVPCPETLHTGRCPRGAACRMAHSVFEFYLHPQRYRTQLCREGTACTRKVCFFAHSQAELRTLPGVPADARGFSHGELAAAKFSLSALPGRQVAPHAARLAACVEPRPLAHHRARTPTTGGSRANSSSASPCSSRGSFDTLYLLGGSPVAPPLPLHGKLQGLAAHTLNASSVGTSPMQGGGPTVVAAALGSLGSLGVGAPMPPTATPPALAAGLAATEGFAADSAQVSQLLSAIQDAQSCRQQAAAAQVAADVASSRLQALCAVLTTAPAAACGGAPQAGHGLQACPREGELNMLLPPGLVSCSSGMACTGELLPVEPAGAAMPFACGATASAVALPTHHGLAGGTGAQAAPVQLLAGGPAGAQWHLVGDAMDYLLLVEPRWGP